MSGAKKVRTQVERTAESHQDSARAGQPASEPCIRTTVVQKAEGWPGQKLRAHPYVVMPRRGRLAQIARQSLRVARVHHSRAVSHVQHVLAMLEHGREITHQDLDVVAHDLRFVDQALEKAVVDVEDVIACAAESALTWMPKDAPELEDERTLPLFPVAGGRK